MDMINISFDAWLEAGVANGFVGVPVCSTHDGIPTSADEDAQFEDGEDICLHVLRLYSSPEHRSEVEDNHSPSVWRRTNQGL